MSKMTPKPTDSELNILQVLWESGPANVRFINDELSKTNSRPLKPPVKTRFKEYVKLVQNRDVNKEEVFWKNYL